VREIFLVHDDQEPPTARRSFLEMAGYTVTVLQDADEVMQLLVQKKPALIVLDVLVHGKTGFDLCREIRVRHTPEELPIILCTEIYRSQVFHDEALRVGAQRYLVRPIRLDELVRHVNELTRAGEGREPKVA
jgi:DNA-binding response OmpR family regulator